MIIVSLGLAAAGRRRTDMLHTLRAYAGTTRAERGCSSVQLLQAVDKPSSISWTEDWDSESDLRRHVRSESFRMLLAAMDLSMSAPELRIHEVSSTRGMDWIASIRSTDDED